jgi:ribosomal protein L15
MYIKKRECGASAVTVEAAVSEKSIPKYENNSKKAELTTLMAVDEGHANDLITDSLAKSLISEDKEIVYTHGYKKCIVNIDSLCSSFCADERIDINSMKKRGLISPEARYVKVLGGGVIDKPLTVLANSFSLSAAKMIALTGGKAIKVRTQRDRRAK